jgi:hypothetical protein
MKTTHWNYFYAIENDLFECSRFVEFNEKNFGTYSIEFAQILLRAGSEVDTLAKIATGSDKDAGKWEILRKKFPKLGMWTCDVVQFQIQRQPWFAWTLPNPQAPCWFNAFTAIKHHRDTHFSQANLRNTLDAVGGLLMLLCAVHLDGTIDEAKPAEPRLFVPGREFLAEAKDHALPWEGARQW